MLLVAYGIGVVLSVFKCIVYKCCIKLSGQISLNCISVVNFDKEADDKVFLTKSFTV